MLHIAEQFRFAASIYRRLVPAALSACLLLAAGAASPRATRAQEGAGGAQPQAPRPRTKRVTPLRKSDSAQGSRVTITSDGGALSDYSAYRSGDRYIVVIPQAEAVGGGGGGVSGRGFQGAQVSKRGNDLVYTFKLEPGATARVNQRFNQLDVQFTAQKSAAAAQPAAAATPAPTPRAQRTPAELAGLASPTPAAKATPDTTRLVQTNPNAQATEAVPPAGATPDVSTASPSLTPTPETTPTAAPTAEQIAQVLPTPAAPVSATTTSGTAPGRTLGATVVSNWPWILAALLAVGVALLFVGRRGSRRENELPPAAASAAPALKERPAAKPLQGATATTPVESAAKAAPVPVVAKTAPVVAPAPSKAKETQPEPLAAATKPKKQTKAERRREKQSKAAAEKRSAAGKTKEAAGTAGIIEAKTDAATPAKTDATPATSPDAIPAATPDASVVKAVVPVSAHVPAEEKGIVLGAADAEAAGAEVQKLLAGESYQEAVVGASDSATRQLVAAELSAALTGRNAERIERARAAFLKHGYFEDAASDLQTAEAPGQRAAAALSLALLHDRAATPHLVAALEDPSPDVRRASIEALSQLKDPAACAPLEALRWRERSRQVPQSLIRHAIEACTPAEAEADDTLVADEETIIRESASVAPGAAEEAATAATPTVELPAAEVTA
ncbi:MAG: HEAT repeat domain-containing protein, partial [Acidobacteria bacterium]|nr:HEAT repeat domain-containing protein [Acidobacteriota bacterium]